MTTPAPPDEPPIGLIGQPSTPRPPPAPLSGDEQRDRESFQFFGSFDEFMANEPYTRAIAYVGIAMKVLQQGPEFVAPRDRLLLAFSVTDDGVQELLDQAEENQWFELGSVGSGILPFGLGGGNVTGADAAYNEATWAQYGDYLTRFRVVLDPEALAAALEEAGDAETADLVRNPYSARTTSNWMVPELTRVTKDQIDGNLDDLDWYLKTGLAAGLTTGGLVGMFGRGAVGTAAAAAARSSGYGAARTIFGRAVTRMLPNITAAQVNAWHSSVFARYLLGPLRIGGENISAAWRGARPVYRAAVGALGVQGAATEAIDQIALLMANTTPEAVAQSESMYRGISGALGEALNRGVDTRSMNMAQLVGAVAPLLPSAMEEVRVSGTPMAGHPSSGPSPTPPPAETTTSTTAAPGAPGVSVTSPVPPAPGGGGTTATEGAVIDPTTGLYAAPPIAGSVGSPTAMTPTVNPLVGVPEGWRRLEAGTAPTERDRGGISPANPPVYRYPMYRESQARYIINSMNPAMMESLVNRMAAAGIVPRELRHWPPGMVDSTIVGAFHSLLGQANINARSWEEELTDLERQASRRRDRAVSDARAAYAKFAYLPPDYATLAQSVKSQFSTSVGRDPTEAEVRLLADELAGFDKAAQRAAYQTRRSADLTEQFAQMVADEEIDQMPKVAKPPVQVDAGSRLAEMIESRYGPEIDRRQRVNEGAQNFASMMSSLTGMTQKVGSGGP